MKLAVVGARYWGVNRIRVFDRMRGLNRICDSNVQRLREYQAKEYRNVSVEASRETVVNYQSADVIVIAAPAETDCAFAKRALRACKDEFAEEPSTIQGPEELTPLAEARTVITFVGDLSESYPATTRSQERIDKRCLSPIETPLLEECWNCVLNTLKTNKNDEPVQPEAERSLEVMHA